MATREDLVEYFRSTAKWRHAKAEEHDDADRDARRREHRSGTALERMTKFVAQLDSDDPDLEWVRHIDTHEDGRLVLSERSLELGRRFGINYGAWSHRDDAPTEAQMRNLLRRMDGAEATERHLERRDAGYYDET